MTLTKAVVRLWQAKLFPDTYDAPEVSAEHLHGSSRVSDPVRTRCRAGRISEAVKHEVPERTQGFIFGA